MVNVDALAAKVVMLLVTTGVTVATWIAVPLLTLSVVTTAVRGPAVVGLVENVTVSEVAVAVVTLPTAPSLNTTVSWAAVVSKARPVMVTVVAVAVRLAGLVVTPGVTAATCPAAPVVSVSVVTTAVRL